MNKFGEPYNTTPADRAARAAKKETMRQQLEQNSQLLQQLQQNSQLLQQLQTVVKTQEDIDILSELLGEMTMGSSRGGRRRRRTNKRHRTFRKKRSTKRRR